MVLLSGPWCPCHPSFKAYSLNFPGLRNDNRKKWETQKGLPTWAGGPIRCTRACEHWAVPVVILLAVNATVLGEAGELGLQGQFTFTALQAPKVPLFVHGQQVVPVRDLASTASA
jgi:hypothetical protein